MTSTIAALRMRLFVVCAAALAVLGAAPAAHAQDPPPRIGPFVLDLHLTAPMFPSDNVDLATGRSVDLTQLPGAGLGLQASAHLYLFKVSVVTVGVGAEVAAGRARQAPPQVSPQVPALSPVEERFSTFSPQLSLNFGNGHGWSYLSAGLGYSNWALVPDNRGTTDADTEPLKTLNYGGGARWFAKKHLAFSLDVRLYAINPGSPAIAPSGTVLPGSPRTTLMVIGAGVSLK